MRIIWIDRKNYRALVPKNQELNVFSKPKIEGDWSIKWISKPSNKKSYGSSTAWMKILKEEFSKEFRMHASFCPYCGKWEIIQFRKWGKFTRFSDIEHFLPKWLSKYEHLSINLYNWLLSCTWCNQRLKKDNDPLEHAVSKDNAVFHPHHWWLYLKNAKVYRIIQNDSWNTATFHEEVSFCWNPKWWKRQIFTTNHSDFFCLPQIYFSSQETFNIFNFIYQKMEIISDEISRFKSAWKTVDDYIDYFFENYYPKSENDFLQFSNGKLKHDLIENLRDILKVQFP